MPFQPPPSPDWNYLVDHVLPRAGMFTGRPTFERVVCFIEGFDLATGSNLHPWMTAWTRRRYGATNVGWPDVVVRLALDVPRDTLAGPGMSGLSEQEGLVALALLTEALEEFRSTL